MKIEKIEAKDLLDQLQSPDANVRYNAWRGAGPTGATAISGLGDLMASPDKSIAKCAHGALDTIAHYAARPGATPAEAHGVTMELLKLATTTRPRMVRSDALCLVGVVGDAHAVPGLVKLLSDNDVREDARMALERTPGSASLAALKKAATTVPADYRPSINQSLHDRALTVQNAGIGKAR
jgi:HEAT repeat protein